MKNDNGVDFDMQATSMIINRHFSNLHISNITMFHGGLNNTTRLITCSDKEKYIIRSRAKQTTEVNKEIENLTFQETINSLMVRNNIRVPELYFFGILEELAATYMVLEYIPGTSLADLTLSGRANDQCYEEFGKITRKMHNIALDQCNDIVLKGRNNSWQSSIMARVNSWTKNVSSFSCFSNAVIRDVENVFIEYKKALDEIIQPHFVHGDLWEGNVIINTDDSGKHHIAAIIDFDDAMFGDPEMDFPNGYMFNDSFKRGYGMDLSMDRHAIIRRKLYALLYSMEHFYILGNL